MRFPVMAVFLKVWAKGLNTAEKTECLKIQISNLFSVISTKIHYTNKHYQYNLQQISNRYR